MPSVPGGKAAAKAAKSPDRSHGNFVDNFAILHPGGLPVRAGKYMKRSGEIERTENAGRRNLLPLTGAPFFCAPDKLFSHALPDG
jgi:hypothetical protein